MLSLEIFSPVATNKKLHEASSENYPTKRPGTMKGFDKTARSIFGTWLTIGGIVCSILLNSGIETGVTVGITIGVIVGGFLISNFVTKIRNFWRKLGEAIHYFFAGNLKIDSSLGSHKQEFNQFNQEFRHFKNLVQTSISTYYIGASVLFFDRMKKVVIVHTHRQEIEGKCGEIVKDKYLRPSIPVDEAEMVYLIWHWAVSCGVEVDVKCSCQVIWGGKIIDDSVLSKNLIVIGSTNNKVTEEVQKRMPNKYRYIPYQIEPDKIINKDDGSEYGLNMEMREEYGLITRVSNLQGDDSYVTIVAGCHRRAQRGITSWLSNPENLHWLHGKCPEESFQLLFKAKYEYEYDGNEKITDVQRVGDPVKLQKQSSE